MRKSASQDSTEMKQTIVLNDSEIEGDIILPGDLCLFGKISGNVTAKGKVEVKSGAVVTGNISCVELGGWRLLLCHGHFYSVKETLEELYVHGVEEQVDFVLFGHTHQAYYREGEVVMINPGSVSKFNLMLNDASWGLLTLSKEKDEKNFIKYEKKTCQML